MEAAANVLPAVLASPGTEEVLPGHGFSHLQQAAGGAQDAPAACGLCLSGGDLCADFPQDGGQEGQGIAQGRRSGVCGQFFDGGGVRFFQGGNVGVQIFIQLLDFHGFSSCKCTGFSGNVYFVPPKSFGVGFSGISCVPMSAGPGGPPGLHRSRRGAGLAGGQSIWQ